MVAELLHKILSSNFRTKLYFPKSALLELEELTKASETKHSGQVRVAIESSYGLLRRLRGQSMRKRAEELFASLGVWNTEKNCGVLLYLNISARSLEIVADRGISSVIPQAEWDTICNQMAECFKSKQFMDGMRLGIAKVTELLSRNFPSSSSGANELSDAPYVR